MTGHDPGISGHVRPESLVTLLRNTQPGTPAIQNAIPIPYFGTTPFAAPGLGLIGGAVMLALGMAWLLYRARRAAWQGEPYGEDEEAESAPAAETAEAPAKSMPFAVAFAPIACVVLLNYLLAEVLLPRLDASYLALPLYGGVSPGAVRGLWAIIAALAISIALLMALSWGRVVKLREALDAGANSALAPIFNTASQVGYGAVIASLAGFAVIRDAVLGIAPGNPLVSLSISVNVLAGITGSASGGMSIALQTLGATYLQMAQAVGISPELLHRVTAIATGGLDALPHNGAVITLLSICGLTHRQSYADILVVAVLVPIAALVVVVVLGTAYGSF